MRRIVHVLLILVAVAAVRSCGGAAAVEDRMSAGTRWAAERTGLSSIRDNWRENVIPVFEGITKATFAKTGRTVTVLLDAAENARNTATAGITGVFQRSSSRVGRAGSDALAGPEASGSTPTGAGGNSAQDSAAVPTSDR